MSENPQALPPLAEAIHEHSAAGVDILYSEPSRIMRLSILALLAFVVAALVWSVFGYTDVIITARGQLVPEGEEQRVYATVTGQIDALYVEEGDTVSAGDELAKLRSPQAVTLERDRRTANLALEAARRAIDDLPSVLRVLALEMDAIEANIINLQDQLDRAVELGGAEGVQRQRAELDTARRAREQAERNVESARKDWEGARALVGQAYTEQQVRDLRGVYEQRQTASSAAAAALEQLESDLIERNSTRDAELNQTRIQLESARAQALRKRRETNDVSREVEDGLRQAEIDAQRANRVRVEDIDGQSSVIVTAPVDGVVTRINFKQRGDRVPEDSALLNLAPQSTRSVLRVNVPESDAGLIEPGMTVRVKFDSFPYQRWGLIDGRLEEFSPTTRVTDQGQAFFEGTVHLDRDYFEAEGRVRKLRYGYYANAEIVVEQRRIIDYVLDPLRDT